MDRLRTAFWGLCGLAHRSVHWLMNACFALSDRSFGRLSPIAQTASALTSLAVLCILAVWADAGILRHGAGLGEDQLEVLGLLAYSYEFQLVLVALRGVAVLLLAGVVLARWRSRVIARLQGVALLACSAAFVLLIVLLLQGPTLLHGLQPQAFHRFMRNASWLRTLGIGILLGGWLVLAWLTLLRAKVQAHYGLRRARLIGDRLLPALRSGGDDPQFSSSLWWATGLHCAWLILIPVLLRGCGWEEPYEIPEGQGAKVVLTEIRRGKKEKGKKQKLGLSMNTDILFYHIDPDESEILEETEKVTQNEYQARGVEGKIGDASGPSGGWPDGMPGRVRFIRLQYDGGDWDQDLHLSADDNMLFKLGQITGLPVARRAEQRTIGRLRFFPKGKAPPFVFLTGRGGMNVSNHEVTALRDYCLKEGGMIFADNGGGTFNTSFRAAMERGFPEKSWITISRDDQMFQHPHLFPNGAPAFWHHSGREAVGLRHDGRWVAFYHQGDLNDAWKTGHSGIHEGLANQAYKLGVNVVHYAFTQYLAHHHQGKVD